jgi:dihydroceramide fatty acyl 2-hydroxylase
MKDYQRHTAGRMFENEFLERASKVHPSTPFLFYIPLLVCLEGRALLTHHTSVVTSLVAIPLGMMTWQLMEYAIHRYFFHWDGGNSRFWRKVHDISHGYHHLYPDDSNRLVMPLGASIPLGIVVAGLLALIRQPEFTIPYFVGIVSGYLLYDFLHWASHYRTPKTAWGKALRAHHMAHHFAVHDKNFGISHRWVDALFGTLRRRPNSEPATTNS